MDIKVLGPGCANCRTTYALLEQVARDKGVTVSLTKVEDIKDIMGSGILSTPGVVIDGTVVHSGGVPSRAKVEQWLSAGAPSKAAMVPAQAGGCCGGGAKTKCCG
jgi:small redox-active disulfide protein 2